MNKANKVLIISALVLQFFASFQLISQNNQDTEIKTSVYVDLTNASGNHSMKIEVEPPIIKSETIRYYMPKIVPGTYSINNYGRFISDLKAYDAEGNELKVNREDTCVWLIESADKLKKITYFVKDTYHNQEPPILFEPTGLCIDSAKVFVLNNYCYTGYFDGYKDHPYTVTVTKPQGFYGSTTLPLVSTEFKTDIYRANNYFQLHDNPMMYCLPDTSSIMVNNARIMISVFSPNGKVTSEYLKAKTRELFEAQVKYLGGSLPTDKYTILVYLSEGMTLSGATGALEHFTSTTFVNVESSNEQFEQPFKDVVAHEFFHLVTPLSIHSHEIGEFDFDNPKMSEHLWLYEGSTEYYAQHSQVKYNLISKDEFLDRIKFKIFVSKLIYNDNLSFTELSKGALGKYKPQYGNVYMKGALINMCLDLYLLELSDGKYGLQNLKSDLGKKFGTEKAFNDDELFGIITEMTFPEIKDFIKTYIEGTETIPYGKFLGYAGYDYFEEIKLKVPDMLGSDIINTNTGALVVTKPGDFGKKLKLKEGDVILSVNDRSVNIMNLLMVNSDFERNVKEDDEVRIKIERTTKDGKKVQKILKAKTSLIEKIEKNYITKTEKPSEKQLRIRKAWLEGM